MRKDGTFAPCLIIVLALAADLTLVEGTEERLRRSPQFDPAIPLGQSDMPVPLGPMPRLDPIDRFTPPIDPWELGGNGWGVEGVDEDGDPLCLTNRPPTATCDPEGPRAFLHAGFDARPAADRVVRAAAAGRVVVMRLTSAPVTGLNPGEAGGIVVLEHDRDGNPETMDDRLLTVYGHVDPEVDVGGIVAQGERIALTSTQRGIHLHFGVRQGAFDPTDRDVFRALLPPDGTSGCAGCYSRPLPAPVFPDRWQDPGQLFAASPFWLSIYGEATDSASDVIETSDGSMAFGYTWHQPGTPGRSMAVRSLDREGNLVSQRAYYVSGFDTIKHVERTPDGGVIALALNYSNSGVVIPMLVKFDAAGEPQWTRQYGAAPAPGFPPIALWWEDIVVTADGGYVVTGTARITATVPTVVLVARLDATGNIQWVRTYDPFLADLGIDGKGIAPTADGGFIVVAEYRTVFFPSPPISKELLVFHIDSEGAVLWGTNLGNGFNDARAGQIEATPDGGSIVVGYRTLSGIFLPSEMWVVKLNADGTIAWNSLYGSPSGAGLLEENGTRLVLTSDGGYVVAGHRTRFPPAELFGPDTDLILMRLDGAGEIVGQRRLDSLGVSATPLGLRATADGFLLAAGAETDCRTCPFLSESAARFLVAHLDENLDCPGRCTQPYDLVRHPRSDTSLPVTFREGVLTGTSLDRTLTRVDTAGGRHPCDHGAFGSRPGFEPALIEAVPEGATCDRTEHVEAYVCYEGGLTGVQATSPVVVDASYELLRLTAHVVDGDSTPERNDVIDVTATFVTTIFGPQSALLPLLDDGSLTVLPDLVRTFQACNEDPVAGVCRCGLQSVSALSGDVTIGDGIYTREIPLTIPHLEGALECILEETPRGPLFGFASNTVSLILRATDRIGNATTAFGTVTSSAATASCSGDECGCCLLVHPQNGQVCAGLPGMVSNELPDGLCRAF